VSGSGWSSATQLARQTYPTSRSPRRRTTTRRRSATPSREPTRCSWCPPPSTLNGCVST